MNLLNFVFSQGSQVKVAKNYLSNQLPNSAHSTFTVMLIHESACFQIALSLTKT